MRKTVIVLSLLVALLIYAGAAQAQSLSFSLVKETVNVFWNEDGTESIDYVFTFQNSQTGSVIDYVDVGIPNPNFDESSISADVDGNPVTDISKSGFQGNGGSGVAVGLGSYSIQPGTSGNVHVYIGKVNRVLELDSQDQNYASAVFSPSWFGSQYVSGSTDMTVTFHLPPGVKSDEPRWHQAPDAFPSTPETALDDNNRIIYSWHNPTANAYTKYDFGASFPKSYVPSSAIASSNPFGFLGGINFANCLVPLGCIGFFALIIGASLAGDRKRKMQYLPPRIAIEGHGIKRGLTSIEAGILMEEPMDKILTMILFSLIKKNAAQVTSRDPLEIKPIDPMPEGLYPYEKDFLQAFQKTGKDRQKDLQATMVSLIKEVTEKMKGFSRKETVAYYKDIMQRAWSQVEAAQTPDVKSQKYDEVMEWTMLDKDFNDRTRDVFRQGPVFIPIWWGRYDPGFGRATTSSMPSAPSGGGGGSSGGTPSMPTLPGGTFAASIVGGIQNFSSSVVGNITSFTNQVTNQTNPPPKPATTSYRGGGGGGSHCVCACACACAGCACACAGGGR